MKKPIIIQFSKIKKQVPVDMATQQECLARIVDCYLIAKERGATCDLPTVSFDLRGTTAGKAYFLQNHIQLNPILLNENKAAFIARTVGHEAAHLIARKHFGDKIKSHGVEWQQVMGWLGQEASRCHTYDTKNASVIKKTIEYTCGCNRAVFISKANHLLIQSKRRKMICRECRQAITLSATNTSSVSVGVTPLIRPPSLAMIRFAESLALKNNVHLHPDVLKSFVDTHLFIEKHKIVTTTSSSAPSDIPTAKQIELAVKLAKAKKLVIPENTLNSKKALSTWISQQLQPKNN